MDGSRLSGESLHDEGKQFDTKGSCSVIVLLTFNDAVSLSWARYSSLLLYLLTLVSFILSAFHSLNILPSTVLSTQWVHSQCLLNCPSEVVWDLFTVFLFLMTCLSSTPAWLPLTGPLTFPWHTPRLEAVSIASRVNQPSFCGPPHPAPVSSWLSLRTTKMCLWNWFANSAWTTDGADAVSSASSPLQHLTPCLPHNLSKDLLKEWMNEENG